MATADSDVWPPALEDDPELAATVAGVSAVTALLGKGVRVALTKENRKTKKVGPTQRGGLVLDGDSLNFGILRTKVSSIHAVEHEDDACRILLKEDAPGSSFRFFCTDGAGDLSSLQVTKCIAFLLRQKLQKEKLAESSPSTFTELLEPLGLADKYGAAFDASGIPFENLSVVTRDDLAEVVGVTDKVDQINIMTQIKRQRPDLGPPVTKVSPNQALLKEGVRAVLETDGGSRKKKSRKEMGSLVLDGDRLKFDVTQPKKRVLTVAMSSIRDVEQEENACKVWLNEEGGNSSLSFACSDPAGVALSIKQALSGQPTAAGDTSTFAVRLGGLGLADKYCAAFKASRIPFENLGDMTRDDLAELLELVGVTDRLDQINIKAQIKRCFPDLDPPPCSCNNERQSSNQLAAGFEAAGKAVEGFGAILEALA